MSFQSLARLATLLAMLTSPCFASVEKIYKSHCETCHGKNLKGGMSAPLNDNKWQFGGSVKEITHSISEGIVDKGMPAWKDTLSPEEIRSLVIFIQEQQSVASNKSAKREPSDPIQTQLHNFKLKKIAEGSGVLWSIDFLPDGTIISAQRDGKLWLFKDGKTTQVKNTPKVWQGGQAGLLEAAVHPDYQKNGWIYLVFSQSDDGKKGMTSIVRGKLKNTQWVEQQSIYKTQKKYEIGTQYHFGSRIVFKDGFLFFSIGDRGRQDMAQDIATPNGKIHRIHDDGRIPKDNPFINKGYATIYSYGNRNPQGLDIHPLSGELWESEHGPRGGDEINLIEKGKNYGWPSITYGMNYNGTPITSRTEQQGMEQPKLYWVPSIAVSGIDFYAGKRFPKWNHNLLVASLKSEELHRLTIKNNQVVNDEILFKNLGRLRDIAVSDSGRVFVTLNDDWQGSNSIFELIPQD